ncbi:hypothetical protein BH23GEM3_BH23GEM3_24300 [soil metagenome]|nr:hypothetical protein [Gemmatimonadota bacterium]
MPDHHHRCPSLSRVFLLLAGVLYFLGAAAEPLLHANPVQAQGGMVVLFDAVESGSDESDSPVPHNESQCLLCKAAGPLVVPDGGLVLADHLIRAPSAFRLSTGSRASSTFALPQSRAPPFV